MAATGAKKKQFKFRKIVKNNNSLPDQTPAWLPSRLTPFKMFFTWTQMLVSFSRSSSTFNSCYPKRFLRYPKNLNINCILWHQTAVGWMEKKTHKHTDRLINTFLMPDKLNCEVEFVIFRGFRFKRNCTK